MPGASLRTEGDDDSGIERVDDRRESRPHLAQYLERGEPAIRQTEQVELSHAEPIGGAVCFLDACGGKLGSGWDMGEIANTFRAIGGDHEVGLASFSGQARKKRTDDAFVVWVSEHGQHGPPGAVHNPIPGATKSGPSGRQ